MESQEDIKDGSGDLSAIDILKRMQQQMLFLERKVDHLTNLLEKRSSGDRDSRSSHHSKYSKPSGDAPRPHYGSKGRKFSRGYSDDGDKRSSENSAGKKKFYSKPFGNRGRDKKKSSAVKKMAGKFHNKNR